MTSKDTAPNAQAPKKARCPMKRGKKFGICAAIVIVMAGAGIGFWHWHETPGFCAAICHNMDPYLDTYLQDQNAPGIDKYGNAVSDTSAMLSTRHRLTHTTAKPEIRCMDCHHPVIAQQMQELTEQISGNYQLPQTEPNAHQLVEWEKAAPTQFCSNENCHSYLMGADGLVNRANLEKVTVNRKFNPHSQHHPGLEIQCTDCHKGHRASVLVCTGCHEHENVELPKGWVTKAEGDKILANAKANPYVQLSNR